jgi:hypothetical protein
VTQLSEYPLIRPLAKLLGTAAATDVNKVSINGIAYTLPVVAIFEANRTSHNPTVKIMSYATICVNSKHNVMLSKSPTSGKPNADVDQVGGGDELTVQDTLFGISLVLSYVPLTRHDQKNPCSTP